MMGRSRKVVLRMGVDSALALVLSIIGIIVLVRMR